MAYDYSNLVATTQHWAKQAHNTGWLSAEHCQALETLDTRSAASLFVTTTRPLIVAFMGGTGVGKSALLNRLAGKTIAKSGVERPTSREVTLFHHASIALPSLAEQLPLAKIKLAQHDDDSKKNIVWIDMPDFDSTELSNKQQVLSWLPHIDVLIYVVSPERYRDEKAWRILLAEGGKHAWLFVLNQWDRGQIEQLNDFNQQLQKAGFVEPLIFKTACTDEGLADDFTELAQLINSLANENTIAQLQQHGTQVRKQELKQQLENALASLGASQHYQHLKQDWQMRWQQTTSVLQQGLTWSCQQLAQYYANQASHVISDAPLINRVDRQALVLWDDWANARFQDAVDELISAADAVNLPISPLKQALWSVRDSAAKTVKTQAELAVRVALANPGNRWQRAALKMARICEFMLPMLAMTWVAVQVFIGYYHSNMTTVPYLGVDFAIHSSLLIALTWLIPFFILKKAQPSLEKSALAGLNKGIATAFSQIDNEVIAALEHVSQQHAEHCEQLNSLLTDCNVQEPLAIQQNSPLQRMLL